MTSPAELMVSADFVGDGLNIPDLADLCGPGLVCVWSQWLG